MEIARTHAYEDSLRTNRRLCTSGESQITYSCDAVFSDTCPCVAWRRPSLSAFRRCSVYVGKSQVCMCAVSPDRALVDWVHLASRRTLVGLGEVVRIGQWSDHSVAPRHIGHVYCTQFVGLYHYHNNHGQR